MKRNPDTFANMWLCLQHYVSHYCCHLVSNFDFFIYIQKKKVVYWNH